VPVDIFFSAPALADAHPSLPSLYPFASFKFTSSSTSGSIAKQSVLEICPQDLALPIARHPLFSGFYKAVVLRNPGVVAAIEEMMKRGQPYLGTSCPKTRTRIAMSLQISALSTKLASLLRSRACLLLSEEVRTTRRKG
jgi:hypothetical protein